MDRIEKSKAKIQEHKKAIQMVENTWTDLPGCSYSGMPKNPTPSNDRILNMIDHKDRDVERLKRLIEKEEVKIEEILQFYRVISLLLSDCTDRQEKIIDFYYFKRNNCIETCYLARIGKTTFRRENNHIINKIEELLRQDEESL